MLVRARDHDGGRTRRRVESEWGRMCKSPLWHSLLIWGIPFQLEIWCTSISIKLNKSFALHLHFFQTMVLLRRRQMEGWKFMNETESIGWSLSFWLKRENDQVHVRVTTLAPKWCKCCCVLWNIWTQILPFARPGNNELRCSKVLLRRRQMGTTRFHMKGVASTPTNGRLVLCIAME